jgi:hypothetical protein
MLYQCNYAARVREMVAKWSPCANGRFGYSIPHWTLGSRAHRSICCACAVSGSRRQPESILCLDRSLDVWTRQSLRSHTTLVPSSVTAVVDPSQRPGSSTSRLTVAAEAIGLPYQPNAGSTESLPVLSRGLALKITPLGSKNVSKFILALQRLG